VDPGLPLITDSNAEIAQQLDYLRRRTQETGEDLRKMEQEQEAFALQYHECTKLNGKQIIHGICCPGVAVKRLNLAFHCIILLFPVILPPQLILTSLTSSYCCLLSVFQNDFICDGRSVVR